MQWKSRGDSSADKEGKLVRLVRFGPAGQERPGVLHEDESTILDVSSLIGDFGPDFFATDGLAALAAAFSGGTDALPTVAVDDVRLGPPVSRPHKLLCIGLNFADHAAESGLDVPAEPVLFMKATNTIVGPHDDVFIPRGSTKTDWEVELGLVIGSSARYLEDEAAGWDCIAGYVLSNDVSERAFQIERGGQWTKGKSSETFNPLGPWFVSRDEIKDPMALGMWLDVNDAPRQRGSTATMVFSPGYIVWYLSHFLVLEPGDVINTGTPPGVGMGMKPPTYLRDGDVVQLGIDGLGVQRQVFRQA